MNILEKIIAAKKSEVEEKKALVPAKLLEQSIHFDAPVLSMKKYITRPDKSGIISEFKRKSPSKGLINPYAKVEEVTVEYMQAGSSGLSVLTDNTFFGGSNEDLLKAREFNFCPILRKDFIISEYQIIEARSIGADVILLIAECLEKEPMESLAKFAKSLGLEVLMELHSQAELSKVNRYVDIVGINNRDLTTFEVNLENSIRISDQIPNDFVRISESGISDPETIVELKKAGFHGFLIGENFMKTADPGKTCMHFIQEIKKLEPKV
jgi:indole-3-glycerol phosphate synthase